MWSGPMKFSDLCLILSQGLPCILSLESPLAAAYMICSWDDICVFAACMIVAVVAFVYCNIPYKWYIANDLQWKTFVVFAD